MDAQKIHLFLTNSHYSSSNPVKVLMDVGGTLNVSNPSAEVSVTGIAFEDD